MLDKRAWTRHIKSLSPLPTGLSPRGSPDRPVRCCLFDIYGTLFISGTGDIGVSEKQDHDASGIDRMLDRRGVSMPRETLVNRLHGAIRDAHRDMKRNGVDYPEVDILRIWRGVLGADAPEDVEAFALEYEMIVNPVHPMPNLRSVLAACRESGVPMGIVSNAQFYTPFLFNIFLGEPPEKLGFNRELVFYSYKHGRAKPSDAMFRRAAKALAEMSIPPETTLYTGNDIRNDILPARRAGFMTALFAGDRRSLRQRKEDEACKDANPDLVITDLAQLASVIRERG